MADLGTFLPLAMGLILIGGVEPTGLLFGFGVFAIASAFYYKRPIPIQPMKATAAMGIAGLIGPDVLVATGILLGITLLLLSQTNAISWIRTLIPRTVIHGLRIALAISLVTTALGLGKLSVTPVLLLLMLLIALQFTRLKVVSCLIVLAVGWLFVGPSSQLDTLDLVISLPAIALPAADAFLKSMEVSYLPQLALTITNALILTAVIAQDYFPERSEQLTEKQFALSSGFANLLLAPFGAIPMCHGAGGLSAHFGQGSRTGWSVGIFGVICLSLSIFLGPQATTLLATMPYEVLGALVLSAAWFLADPPSIARVKPSCKLVIAVMVLLALWGGFMTALIGGIVLEWCLARYLKPKRVNS